MAKNGNKSLGEAKKQKKDEFYTQLGDINAELGHYSAHFAGKVVFCNCDDPYESNFFKYFAANFNALRLKRLIATCYAGSPVAGRQLELFEDVETGLTGFTGLASGTNLVNPVNHVRKEKPRIPHKIVINEVTDVNGDGRIDLAEGDSGKELRLKPVPREIKKVNHSLRDGQLYLMKGGKPVKPFSRIIIRRRK